MTTQLALVGLRCFHLIVSISILDTAAVSVAASFSIFIAITVQGCTINTLLITKSKDYCATEVASRFAVLSNLDFVWMIMQIFVNKSVNAIILQPTPLKISRNKKKKFVNLNLSFLITA
jgi:hypothetical protein